jgi:deoxyhypusine synthase
VKEMKKNHFKYFKNRIQPNPLELGKKFSVAEFVDSTYFAYNSARLKEACHLGVKALSQENVTVGITLAGALTPASLGVSTIIPLIEAGYVDFIISTGANLYHDLHYALNYALYSSQPNQDDIELRKEGIIRIYDILFSADVLFDTDAFVRTLLKAPEFNKTMSTAEFHNLIGNAVNQVENNIGTQKTSILAACYRNNVPIYTSSPGDSTFGMNLAAMQLKNETACVIDPSLDVNETSAIVWDAVSTDGETAVIIVGGGSPKNFYLQTEPYLQEILGLPSKGHDYFIQFTDSRPDTGGLSGATPSEALSWGKIDPEHLIRTVVVYADSTIVFPIWAAYLLENGLKKAPKELFKKLSPFVKKMLDDSKNYNPPIHDHELAKNINFK